MGLDITVYRLKKLQEQEDNSNFFTVENIKNLPEWSKSFITKREQEYYDWNKFKEESGIDAVSLQWRGEEYSEKGCFLYLKNKETDEEITVDLEKVPTYKQLDDVIGIEEVGYQRKRLNHKFYEDYEKGKIGYFVWSKRELERYKEEYCDEVNSFGGNAKEHFQKNIIDNFIEGKDCVTFDW